MRSICRLRPEPMLPFLVVILTAGAGCAAGYERSARARATGPVPWLSQPRAAPGSPEPRPLDGSLDQYVAAAMREHPEMTAAYEEWRAAVYAIARERRLPDPELGYGIETLIDSPRHHISVRQMLPWPSKLSAGADAASGMARAAERSFEAALLSLRRRVADAYWRLWEIRRMREIHRGHRQLITDLAEVTRTRIAVGRAALADVSQIDLRVSRMDDAIGNLDVAERGAEGELLAVANASATAAAPTTDAPLAARAPADSGETLLAAAAAHPRIRHIDELASATDARAVRADKEGLPSFMFGLEYVEMEGDDMDPLMISVGITLPLWRDSYRAEVDSARAGAASLRARSAAEQLRARGQLAAALADVADSARRIQLYEHTLIPQAESVYEAVTGAYQTGDATLAAVLLAQEDVLDLGVELVRSQANHARAWASLEELVGRHVDAKEVSHD